MAISEIVGEIEFEVDFWGKILEFARAMKSYIIWDFKNQNTSTYLLSFIPKKFLVA